MINLIAKSLWNRKGTALLTLFSIAISVALLIGVEQIRKGVRTSFSSAVSGTDLIVGARGGSLQLLLYSVFRMGNAPNISPGRVTRISKNIHGSAGPFRFLWEIHTMVIGYWGRITTISNGSDTGIAKA